MAYQKQNFVDGKPLSAAELNRMEEGIAAAMEAGGGNVPGGSADLTGYAKEAWVQENYQPKGDYPLRSELPDVPVQSVNGKTGAVKLTAEDVSARPSSWMPTAADVGALPNTYKPPNQTAQQVGADPAGTAANAVSGHNSAADAHADIRLQLTAINDRLKAFFDSDDQTLDELSEIVAYITSNKSLIDAITTSKVSVLDIVNDLVTNVPAKPLSAAQGVVLKGMIDNLSTGKLDASKLQEAINTALAQAKASGEFDGQRGTGILNVTSSTISASGTGPTGIAIKYKIALSTVKDEAGVDEVLVGDTVKRSVYLYPVANVDASYVYLGAYTSIKGSTGPTGPQGERGPSGVYVGSDEPTDPNVMVWIDPQGDILAADDIVAEANRVVDTALTREDSRILRFIAFADAHQKNDHELITAGNKELGQGIGEIVNQIGVDFVSNLGDSAWAAYTNTTAEVREQIKTFNRFIQPHIRGEQQLNVEGNHDDATYSTIDADGDGSTASDEKFSLAESYSLVWAKNRDVVYDPDYSIDGYCYKDFSHIKTRVICLNTEQGDSDGAVMAGYQLKWLAETALNMSDKTDWNVVTLAHHPLDWGSGSLFKDCVNIVDAFLTGSNFSYATQDGTAIAIDYSNKNCQFVGHFHGHTHAFCVTRMQKYVDGSYADIDVWQIGIPNACYGRNNQNLGHENERMARYSTSETYNKEDVDGKRTSFNVVTVCLDEKMIYADNFGAGIDREVSYAFEPPIVNQIPISTDTDGSIYSGVGYKENTYLGSSGSASSRDGIDCTGFIPIGYGSANNARGEQVIYMDKITALAITDFRIAFYDNDKKFIAIIYGTNMFDESADDGTQNVVYAIGVDGNIVKVDVTGYTSYLHNSTSHNSPAFFRISTPNIDGDSILTVNQPIE